MSALPPYVRNRMRIRPDALPITIGSLRELMEQLHARVILTPVYRGEKSKPYGINVRLEGVTIQAAHARIPANFTLEKGEPAAALDELWRRLKGCLVANERVGIGRCV